jgi:hypothetical protein
MKASPADPVGATWEGKSGNGHVGRVTLERRDDNLEVWLYYFGYSDEKVAYKDWAPSRRKAVALCQLEFFPDKPPRFRRVADSGS